MGNATSGAMALENDDNPLTKDEQLAINKLYESLLEDNVPSQKKFTDMFSSEIYPNFGCACYSFLVDSAPMTLPLFQKFVINGSRSPSNRLLQLVWNIIQNDSTVRSDRIVEYFFRLVLELSGCELNGMDVTATRLSNYVRQTCNNGEPPSCRTVINWTNEYAPYTAKVFVTYVNRKCFGDIELQYEAFNPPLLRGGSSVLSQCDVIPLALYDKSLQGSWERLYTTQQDGFSFNRIAHHILGYRGPSLILIKCRGSDIVLGAYNEDQWRDSNRFYGNSASFLCVLSPDIKIFRSKCESNDNYQWLNIKSYSTPRGLGMGGTTEKFRIFIPDTLEQCSAHSSCSTFESGDLMNTPSEIFDIEVMEVWGCGDDDLIHDALAARDKDRGDRDDMIRKARQVDKAAFANNSFDQEFLLPKNFSHKVRMVDDAAAGSCDSKPN